MPVTPDDVRRFERRVRRLQQQAATLANDVRVDVLKIVDEYRRRIKELIDHYPPKTPLPAADMPRLSAQIRSEVDAMLTDAATALRAGQEAVWTRGVAAARELALNLDLEGALFAPSAELLTIATGYTADLIRTIPGELMPKVNGTLARAVLGSLSPYETMQELDKLLGRAGQRGVSYQVERIVRTEVQRVYSIALDQQIQALAGRLEQPQKLLKEWIAGPPRPGRREDHQQIDGQQVPVHEPFALPDGTRLMYPRDPAGPPHQTINCGCAWRLVAATIATALDQ